MKKNLPKNPDHYTLDLDLGVCHSLEVVINGKSKMHNIHMRRFSNARDEYTGNLQDEVRHELLYSKELSNTKLYLIKN